MSDSDSDFGTPKNTSTQVTPDKVNNAKNKRSFKSKLGTKIGGTSAVNNFLKFKALGNKSKNGAAPILPKLNSFDDEVPARPVHSAKKKRTKKQSYSSSSEGSSSSSSSDEEQTKRKKPLQQNDDGSSSSDDELNNSASKTKARAKPTSDKTDKKVNIVSNTVVKGANIPVIKKEVKSSSDSSSSSEESSSSDDDNDNKDKKEKNGTSNNISSSSSSSSSSDGSSDSESSSGSSSSDGSSSDSSTKTTKREIGTSGYNSKSGTVSSSDDNSSEDEDNISQGPMTVQATKKTKKVLSNYIDKHGMHPCDKKSSSFNINEDIQPDDEIFTVKVSKQIDPKLLTGQVLKIVKEQSINIDNENYLAEFDKDEKTDLCLLGPSGNEFVVRQLKTKGCFVLNKQYKINKSDDLNINRDTIKREKMPFPTDKIKQRHPIFGNNFEKRITLDKAVSKKLDNLMNDMLKSFEKDDSKLHKADKKKNKQTDVSCDDTSVKAKKKKKRKRDEADMSTDINESKKRKKNSMNIDSILSSFADASMTTEVDETLPKKKKKKKDKSREQIEPSESIGGADTQTAIVEATIKYKKLKGKATVDSAPNIEQPKSPKKAINKQLANIINSTMCSPSLGKTMFEPDTSIIEKPVEKKHKKNKKVVKEELPEIGNNSKSKKHKKDKNLSDSHIIASNTSKEKKKSKKSKKGDVDLDSLVSGSLKEISNQKTAYHNEEDSVQDAPKKSKKRRPTIG